ncbi:helix-turn-helix domain-containing protein [Cellulomonas sp. NPDC089187]|uniref:helix-turn-helix transcriptional regulator n=1 Tax=Cellulomonas sp. NPDC089187 TaxID=3154970 RepID=UPI00341513EC
MTIEEATSQRVLAAPSRAAILRTLTAAPAPLTVDEVAQAVGLHVNTAREHLDVLVGAGLVLRSTETRTTRGRPRRLYAAVVASDMRDELSRALLSGYGRALSEPGVAAEQAGQDLVGDAVGDAVGDGGPEEQMAALWQHFASMGFDPEVTEEGLRLRRCPIRELARERMDVVCGVHLGMARGLLRRIGGPVRAEALLPFAGPGYCVLRLDARGQDG